MQDQFGKTIQKAIEAFRLPSYSQIPDVGLFLEQVCKYINGFFEPLPEFCLTSSMVSNYVKKGLISNPVKKQYGREQIACLFFITVGKTVLSLEELQLLLRLQAERYRSTY